MLLPLRLWRNYNFSRLWPYETYHYSLLTIYTNPSSQPYSSIPSFHKLFLLVFSITLFHISMASFPSTFPVMLMISTLMLGSLILSASASNLYQDFDITWGDGRAKILNSGELLTLSLDKTSGSGFQSKNEFLFGKIDMQLKLVPGNSAGTVTAYYVSSPAISSFASIFYNTILFIYIFHASRYTNIYHLFTCEFTVILKRVNMGWDRLWVPWQFEWWSLHHSHQCVQPRQGQQRAAILSLVWPNCRFPHLFCPLEPPAHHVSIYKSTFLKCLIPRKSGTWFDLLWLEQHYFSLDSIFVEHQSRQFIIAAVKTIVFIDLLFQNCSLPPFYLFIFDKLYKLMKFYVLCFSFSVDGTPIREFKNLESIGVPFPKNQAMRIYSSLWNADDWATRGGLVKTDWTQAPFTASYRNFNANACVWSSGVSSCSSSSPSSASTSNAWLSQELDSTSQDRLKWVQKNYMIYNYCTDTKRFPQGLPLECTKS